MKFVILIIHEKKDWYRVEHISISLISMKFNNKIKDGMISQKNGQKMSN